MIGAQKPDSGKIIYRRAEIADSSDIREILKYYIDNTFASWRYQVMDRSVFESWIVNHKTPQRPFWVAEFENRIIGYSCLSDFRNGEGYWPCAEDSVYVRPEFNGQGIGRKLMELIIQDGQTSGLKAIIAGIDADNDSSIRFHKHYGFYECGLLKNIGWKDQRWLSLVFMQLDLK